MWFKVIGSMLLVTATTTYGFQKARGFRERTYDLRAFQDGLSMLQTEVTYGLTPLPLAMKKISKVLKKPVGSFFKSVSQKLLHGEGELLEVYWNDGLQNLECSLTKEDLEVVNNLGYSLGRSSVSEQKKHLELTIRQLQMAEKESKEICAKNEKMWKYLGFFSGLALVLVLL